MNISYQQWLLKKFSFQSIYSIESLFLQTLDLFNTHTKLIFFTLMIVKSIHCYKQLSHGTQCPLKPLHCIR